MRSCSQDLVDEAVDEDRYLLQLPPVLHGRAAHSRHRWARREVHEENREPEALGDTTQGRGGATLCLSLFHFWTTSCMKQSGVLLSILITRLVVHTDGRQAES